ncbi:MAG: isopentenyl-diphosphate Delta-isomerase [Patescibacteria group bacterium]
MSPIKHQSKTSLNKPNLVWVDQHDRVVGEGNLILTHTIPARLHRAISVFYFRLKAGRVELLCQQRSATKIVAAGQWANTTCGNVWVNESFVACAKRRLKDELGLEGVTLNPLLKFHYQVDCNEKYGENELDQLFAAITDDHDILVEPNPIEVERTAWLDWWELRKAFSNRQPMKYSGGVINMSLNIDGKKEKLTLAPWFEIMMSKKEIIDRLNRLFA